MPLSCTKCGCLFEGTHKCHLDKQTTSKKLEEINKLITINEIRTIIARLKANWANTKLNTRIDGFSMLDLLDNKIREYYKLN